MGNPLNEPRVKMEEVGTKRRRSLRSYLEFVAAEGGFRFEKGVGKRTTHPLHPKLAFESFPGVTSVSKNLFWDRELVAYINRDESSIEGKEGKQYAVCVATTGFMQFYSNPKKAIADFSREAVKALKAYGLGDGASK